MASHQEVADASTISWKRIGVCMTICFSEVHLAEKGPLTDFVNRYTPTSRLGFIHGTSETLTTEEVFGALAHWLNSDCRNITLVGHGM